MGIRGGSPTDPKNAIVGILYQLPPMSAEELRKIVMRRYERTSTLLTSNRSVEDWES